MYFSLQQTVSAEAEVHRKCLAKQQELEKLLRQNKKTADYLSLELEKVPTH